MDLLFSTFKNSGVDYVLPASLTLFGNGSADSKTLMMSAIRQHYPELEAKYVGFFKDGVQMPAYYRKAFKKKMKAMSQQYGISDQIGGLTNKSGDG